MIAGTLEIQLMANMARLQKDMDDARRAVGGAMATIEKSVGMAKAALGTLGAGLTIGAFASMIKGSIDAAAGLNDLAIQTGATVEALSGMAEVGRLSDVSAQMIGSAMNKLAKNLAGASEESKGTGKAIEALGINFDAFKKLNPEEQMQAVAKAMGNSADGSGKAAVAMALYGKEGVKMLPFLKDLATAGDLHAIVTAEQAAQSDNFNDNLTRLQVSGEAWTKELAMGMVPALDLAAQSVVDVMNESGGLRDEVRKLAADGSIKDWTKAGITGLSYLVDAAQYVIRAVKATGESIGAYAAAGVAYFSGIGQALKQVIAGDFTGAVASMKGGIDASKTIITGLGDSLINTFGEATLGAKIRDRMKEIEATGATAEAAKPKLDFTNVLEKNGKAAKEGAKAEKELEKAYNDLIKTAQALANARNAEADGIAAWFQAEEKARLATVKAANDSVQAAQDEYDNYGKTKSQIAEVTLARLTDKLQGVNAGTEIAASIQLEIDAQNRLIGILQKGELREASVDAAKDAAAEWKKTADDIERGLTDSLFRAFESGKGFFAALWSGITNLFKTTALKLIISPVSSAITGALGFSGTANAATGGGGVMGALSNLSSLNTIGSVIGNGITQTIANVLPASLSASLGLTSSALAASNAALIGGGASASAAASAAAAAGNATALGGLGSAMAAIPGVGWAALAAVAVASIFGGRGKKESTGGGIEGSFGDTGFSGNSFSTWKQDGGWFHSDRTGKETSGLDAATTSQFTNSYQAVKSAASSAAVALGLSADAVTNYSQSISLQLGKDAAENEKAVAALFAGMGDSMASAVAPGIAQLAKEGESAGGTLTRLAGSLTTANAWLDRFGANMLQVSLAGGDAASKLADQFGGLDNLNAASAAFYATYFSDAERAAQSTDDMSKALGALGLALPASKEEFRALALSMDRTTDAGRTAYAALLTLAPEFASTTDALATLATQATTAIESLFDTLSSGIKSALENIAGERLAVAAAALQINAPGAMSRDAILRGIAGTALATPGNAGLSSAQSALSQADAAVAAQAAAVAYAKSQAPSRVALDAAAGALGVAQNAARAAQAQVDNRRTTEGGKFAGWVDQALAGRSPTFRGGDMRWGENQAVAEGKALLAAQAAQQTPQAAYDVQVASYAGAVATNAAQIAAAQAQLSAATAAQTAAVTASRDAQLSYIGSLQDFAIDASKAVTRLGTLREETLKYYDAQKQLADLMATSAAGLRESVRTTRLGQLDAKQSLAQQQAGFASAYSMALASTGAVQAGYADKLGAALPDLSAALMDTSSTRAEWALATAKLFAQSETIASQLEANAPQDYAADSLAMLGQIDAALMVLDASSKSAEKIIADAVTAGSNKTADGLRAVIAALTGEAIPAFAAGGDHVGGARLVGEYGPELEVTGPSRIFNASQTRAMLSGGAGADTGRLEALVQSLTQEVQGLRAEARATASHSAKTARILTRVTRDGEALQTVAAE